MKDASIAWTLTVTDLGSKLDRVRPSGAVEEFGPGNRLTIGGA